MARGRSSEKKRIVQADPVYGSFLVAKFINRMMRHGKKTSAQKQVYLAFEILKEQGKNPVEVFESAINNIGPKVEVRAKRIGGAAYQVPVEVRGERRTSLAIRWMLEAIHKRSNKDYKSFAKKLVAEIQDANNNAGEAIRKRDIAYRMADANKAFAHFKW